MDFDDPSSSDEGGNAVPMSASSGNEPPSPTVTTQVMSLPAHARPDTAASSMAGGKRNCREVQSFVFDEDDGDDNEQNENDCNGEKGAMTSGLQRTSYDGFEGHLHYQLVEPAENVVRPLARHGCDASGSMGRLGGHPTENTGTHKNVDEVGDEESEEDEEMSRYVVEDDDREVLSVEDDREWDSVLRPMSLVDMTLLSQFYMSSNSSYQESEMTMEGSVCVTETMVKTLSLFYAKPAKQPSAEAPEIRQMAVETLHHLALHMQSMQRILTEAGLTVDSQIQHEEEEMEHDAVTDQSGVDPQRVICRGVHSVHVDSACRLIGVIDIDACAVSLSDVIALSSLPFSEQELVAILKSVIQKVAALHDAGLVHGCLHGGNVLCCTDDGRTVLTGACGIMSNPLLPADASFISPRLARALQPFVRLVWSHQEQVNEETFPWTSDPAFHRAVLERYGCTGESEMQARPSDDIYAIGVLAVACLLGVPPFHSATLKEVVEILAPHNPEKDDDNESDASLLGNVLTSNYAVQRFKIAGYTEAFIASVKEFVHTCLRAATTPHFVAGTLLTHSFFVDFPIQPDPTISSEGAAMLDDEMDESALLNRTVHCVLYPIFVVMESVRKDCGTTPLVPRLLRNSIFASRWNALQCGQSYQHAKGLAWKRDTVGTLWPSLDRRRAPHRDESDAPKGTREANDNQEEENALKSLLYRSLPHSCGSPSRKTADNNNMVVLASTVEAKGMRVDTEAHALVFSGKSGSRLVLYRDEVPAGYEFSVDTLILQDLENCVVEILMGFRFMVISNVRRCKLFLGPCYYLYCESVSDCSPVVVSSAHVLMHDVSHLEVHCGGGGVPRGYGDVPLPESVTVSPCSMAYAGLTADFAAVSLPQEHMATLLPMKDAFDSAVPVSRALKLYNMLRGGFDYPYSHALAAFGTRFTHENDGASNVFLFFSEVAGKSVCIARIHGDRDATLGDASPLSSEVSSLPSPWLPRHEEGVGAGVRGMAAERKGSSSPIIFIMDLVGDCVIEDCSHCTVFVVGSSESVTVRRCTEMCLFVMAKEALFEYCDHIETHLLVTEYLFMDHCYQMNLVPLALEAPHLEEILASIIEGCTDVALRRSLEHALHQKNESVLNVLLRAESDSNAVDLVECVDMHIDEYREHMILVDFVPSDVPPSRFFYEAAQGSRGLNEWVVVPFLQKTWRRDKTPMQGLEPPPVCLHDVVNASILRLPGTLNPCAAPDGASSAVDVTLERISLGVVHLVEAIRTLIIRGCTGPLDIVVCSATRVIMESCEHVTFQIACGAFTARDCHACHIALHVNTPPRYENCTFMQASTLNITSKDFENYLARAGVELDVNLFDHPVVQCPHSEGDVPSSDKAPESNVVDSVEWARAILHRPVTFVCPLPATCLGIEDASFIGPLEDRVSHEEATRTCYDKNIIAALSFLSCRQVMPSVATQDSLKGTAAEEPSLARSDSEGLRMLEAQQVEERHFDPLVDCSADNARSGSCNAAEEPLPPLASGPRSDTVRPPGHTSGTGTTKVSPRGDGPRVCGDEPNRMPREDYPHGGDESVDVADPAMPAPDDDDNENLTTVRKSNEMGGDETSGDHQCPAEAQHVSHDTPLPPGPLAGGRVTVVEGESAVGLVVTPSRHEKCESAAEKSRGAVSPAHGKKGSGHASSTTHTSCPTLAVEVNSNDDKNGGGIDKSVRDKSTPRQMSWGHAFSFQDFILEVHPDEEEKVRSVLSAVAASREAIASAGQKSESSTQELQRRVAEAVKRLQNIAM